MGPAGTSPKVLLNASCHKNMNIFMGGDLKVFKDIMLFRSERAGTFLGTLRTSLSVILNAFCYEKNEYIWFRGGDLNVYEVLSLL